MAFVVFLQLILPPCPTKIFGPSSFFLSFLSSPFLLFFHFLLSFIFFIFFFFPHHQTRPVPSDIEIASAQTPKPVTELAREIGLKPSELDLYGAHKVCGKQKKKPKRRRRRSQREEAKEKKPKRRSQREEAKKKPRRSQDEAKKKPRRSQEEAKKKPRRSQEEAKKKPRRSQEAKKKPVFFFSFLSFFHSSSSVFFGVFFFRPR
jgi:hypothetical protein